MKKLLFGVLTAFGVALGANAAIGTTETTFETDDTTVSVQKTQEGTSLTSLLLTGDYWSVDGVNDTGVATTSKVMKYGTTGGVNKSSSNGGFGELNTQGMTTAPDAQYLEIDADSVLLRNNTVTLSTETTSYYIDTMVKFTATDLSDTQMEAEIAQGEKIVVWMYQPEDGNTLPVLKVAAGCVDSVDGNNNQASVSYRTYTASGTYTENTWYRLSVKAINKAFDGAEAVCFVVCIDGKPLTYDKQFYKDGVASIFATPSSMYRSLNGKILPSRVQGNNDATTLAGLGFKGNGAVDNILFSSAAPCDKLIDGSAVMLFKVGEEEFATWQEAVNAALEAIGDTTINLLTDSITDSDSNTTCLTLDFSGVTLDTDKTVVLNLNGKILKPINGTSIEILGNSDSPGEATVQIIDKMGGANVQGDVFVSTCNARIGDASENSSDKGVVYGGALSASEGTITLYKGKFSNDPTVPGKGYEGATVAKGYELVDPAFEGDYFTIAKSTAPTTTSVTITLGEGIASATYKIGEAEGVTITKTTPVENVAIDAVITITAKAATGYTANTIAPVTVSAETTTIDVTATLNNYNLTITLGDGVASATYKLGEEADPVAVESEKPVSVPYNTAVTISATAAEGYTLDAITDASFNMPAEAKTVSITAKKQTGALTVTWSNKNITKVVYIVDTVEKELTSDTAVDIEVGKTVTIVATVSGWNKATGIPDAFAMTAEGKSVTIEVVAISADTDIGETTKPEDVGITGGDFASAAPTELKKVVNWAKANNVSVADVNAMNFENPKTKEEAYLLNCANTEDAVTAAKAEFKIMSFTLVDGKLTPTLPSGYNGTVREKGTDSISGNTINWTYVTPENRGQFKFIKAVLEAVLTK